MGKDGNMNGEKVPERGEQGGKMSLLLLFFLSCCIIKKRTLGVQGHMQSITVEVKNEYGIHARPASLLVELAGKFESDITITMGDRVVTAKSVMNVLLLAAGKGSKLVITADGPDEAQALRALQQLIEVDKFHKE